MTNLVSSSAGVARLRTGIGTDLLVWLLVGLPIACLALNAISWLVYGVDIPFWDDWRPLLNGGAGDLSLKTLFTPANDTLYPVGLLLDSLAQRYLLGNSIAYQFLSLCLVLGTLLLLQWRLLGLVLQDRLLLACAFSATLFMLQPDSYWGLQNMAYHQALPVVGVLFSLDVIYRQRWRRVLSPLLILAAGLLSGMTYISGAFGVLSAGGMVLISALLTGDRRRSVLMGGYVLLFAGIATAIPQGWVIAIYQHGTHRADAPMALPIELDFWMYLFGKVARSLMLPASRPLLSLAWTGVALTLVFVTAFWHLRQASLLRTTAAVDGDVQRQRTLASIYLTIIGVTASYLLIVAAGRANFRDPNIAAALEVFASGFPRFHFFWATILWPWLAAAMISCFTRVTAARILPVAGALLVVTVACTSGVFAHGAAYRSATEQRTNGIACLTERLSAGTPLTCGSLYPSTDLAPALRNAEQLGASFSRTLEALASFEPVPLFGAPAVPLELDGDTVIEQTLPRLGRAVQVDGVAVFVGTSGGVADGQLELSFCQQGNCVAGRADIGAAEDNDFLLVHLDHPVQTQAETPVLVRLSTSGSTAPLAIWAYDAPQPWEGTLTQTRATQATQLVEAKVAFLRMTTYQ